MARFSLLLIVSAVTALLTLGATSGVPRTGGHTLRAELSDLDWAGDDLHLTAPTVHLDLEQRTGLTSLHGTVSGALVEVSTLRLGTHETRFERLHARGSLTERMVDEVRVDQLDLRVEELLRLGDGPTEAGGFTEVLAQHDAGSTQPSPLTLEVARGGLRLSVGGLFWLEGLQLRNARGDTLSIEAVSIPWGGQEWVCDRVTLVEAGVERRFERLLFIAADLSLLAPASLIDRFNDREPEVVAHLRGWE